jgi:hypothetical protein
VNLPPHHSSNELLEEINSKSKKPPIWPWVLGLSICLLVAFAAGNSPIWIYCVIVPLRAGGLVWAIRADKLRKTVVLFYELEPHSEQAFQNLHGTFDLLRGCSRAWHIESKGDITSTYDWEGERRSKFDCETKTSHTPCWLATVFQVQYCDSRSSCWPAAFVFLA